MTPERWQAVRALLEEALAMEPQRRDQWLRDQCRSDVELIEEVRHLLRGHEQATGVLANVQDALRVNPARENLAGKRVGPYQLLESIGQGGMGVVYRASRADPAFEKTVAVKLLGFPLASPEIERAFYKERQILATLEHPNIARLLDGGRTPEELLFLVIELVEGKPIDEYCEQRRLSVRWPPLLSRAQRGSPLFRCGARHGWRGAASRARTRGLTAGGSVQVLPRVGDAQSQPGVMLSLKGH